MPNLSHISINPKNWRNLTQSAQTFCLKHCATLEFLSFEDVDWGDDDEAMEAGVELAATDEGVSDDETAGEADVTTGVEDA